MKRFLAILVVAVMAIGSVSAQKKEVAALTTEVEALKQQNGALSNEVEALKQQNAELQQQINDAKARERKLQAKCDTLAKAYAQVEKLSAQVEALSDVVAKAAGADKVAAIVATAEKPKYQIAGEPSCGMTVVREGLLFGFINSRNEYIIKAQYDAVYDFDRGFACVKKNGKWGVIDTTGKTVIECLYDDLSIWADYSIWRVRNGSHFGLVSAVNGAIIAPVKYEVIDYLRYGRARMKINGKYGFFDEKGKVVIPARYSYADSDGFGVDGTARVEGNGRDDHYIDKSGNFVRNY